MWPTAATTPAGSRGGNPNLSAHSVVYESSDPAHGGWEPVCDFGFGDPNNKTIFEMEPFGDHLYVGTFNLEGYQIWRSTCEGERPYVFEKVIDQGAYRGKLNQCALSMTSFKGALYVGSGIQGGGIATITILQQFNDAKHTLGKFRLSVTDHMRPLSPVKLPAAIAADIGTTC